MDTISSRVKQAKSRAKNRLRQAKEKESDNNVIRQRLQSKPLGQEDKDTNRSTLPVREDIYQDTVEIFPSRGSYV